MAQQFVTGPCDVFVNGGTIDTVVTQPLFLGHSERGPRIQVRPQYTNTYVDLAGLRVGFDAIYDGEDALVSLALNRWNQQVYADVSRKVNTSRRNARGQDKFGDIGTLMIQEGAARRLWLRFPHSEKEAYEEQEAGYRFLAAFLQTDDHADLGARPRKIQLVFHCMRGPDFTNADEAALGGAIFTLFDHDMTGLPPVD